MTAATNCCHYRENSCANAVLAVVILYVCLFVRLSHACFVTNQTNTADILIPYETAITIVC